MAQKADAIVKLVQAKGSPDSLLPVEAAWEELGYSATRREQLKRMRDDARAADPLAAAAEAFRADPAAVTEDPVPAFDATVPGIRA